jgi:phospholipid/cholesterol/gamma-HCH transport system ATP-binding protein
MPDCLIELRDLHKRFDSLVVLDGVSLCIPADRITTIIGKSGVGKSVLLKHIVGLLQPDSGEILYKGESLRQMRRSQRKEFKRQISYMFQNMALFDSMTVIENITLPLEEKTRLPLGEIRGMALEKMKSLELDGISDKFPSELSGGMKKRVALARALITNPKIILFDEPTTGLDPIRKNAVHQMISHYQEQFGFTAIVVSHDIPDVFDISHKVALLDKGKILIEGSSEEVQNCPDPYVRQFILGEADLKTA